MVYRVPPRPSAWNPLRLCLAGYHTRPMHAHVAPNSSLVPLKVAARARESCAAPGLGLKRGGEGYRRGVAQPQDAPERSQRAQRAQRALPDAGSVPTPPAYRNASSTVLPAIGVERDASAGRSGAVQGYPEAHPGGLGEHKARDTLCPKPAACHTPSV